jgi:NADPH-dependent curcumin reductase CurA
MVLCVSIIPDFIFNKIICEQQGFVCFHHSRVLASKNSKYPVDSHVLANVGWRSHTVTKNEALLRAVPPMGDIPLSYALGVMGMPGYGITT